MQEEESVKTGAGRGIRTPDQRFTKPLRYHYAIPANKKRGGLYHIRRINANHDFAFFAQLVI